MNFFYFNKSRYPDIALSQKLENAAQRLFIKLQIVDLKGLNISDYNKKYLAHHTENIQFSLQLFCNILYQAFEDKSNTIEETTLVDYGGGTGLLGFLAAELGVKNIVYVDFYDLSVYDSRVIAESLKYENIDFVHGEVSNLLAYVDSNNITVDVLVSSDVIEHIYKLEDFFESLSSLNKKNKLRFVLQTASNIKNPFKRRELERYQLNEEFNDREDNFGHKQMDNLRSYYNSRLDFIKNKFLGFSDGETNELAARTRGMRFDDIEVEVLKYQKTKVLPAKPSHKTNTCDPNTGNWTERLMEFEWLIKICFINGFETTILKGFYGRNFHESKAKILIKKTLNFFLLKTANVGFKFAPYIILKSK